MNRQLPGLSRMAAVDVRMRGFDPSQPNRLPGVRVKNVGVQEETPRQSRSDRFFSVQQALFVLRF